MKIKSVWSLMGLWFTLGAQAIACTTFMLERGPQKIFGRTLDWSSDQGAAILNRKNIQKKALFINSNQTPLEWQSRFGSLTFNQVGREFPYGGINEKGLVVETLILKNSDYGTPSPSTPAVNESQWIQYMLDRASSLDEVANLAQNLPVVKMFAPLHYFVCDAQAECGTFEFLNGVMAIHRGNDLHAPALANDPYLNSLDYAANFMGLGGTQPLPTDSGSLSRFARAASFAKNYQGTDYVDDSFSQLFNVSNFGTKWQVVYDMPQKIVYFKTTSAMQKKWIHVASGISSSCSMPAKVFDLQKFTWGDVTSQMQDYTVEYNRSLVQRADFLPADLRLALSDFAETSTHCLD